MLKKFNRGRSNLSNCNIATGNETWISLYEAESKEESTILVFQNEPKRMKVVHSHSVVKQMIACFFGYTGHVATVALNKNCSD